MPIPAFLTNLLSGGATKIMDSVKGIIDESKFSAEEKAELELKIQASVQAHEVEMLKLAEQETEAYLKDVQNSRDSNARIQESEKASWLAKNVGYILDVSVAVLFYAMLFLIFFVEVPEKNKEIFYTAFGILGAKYGSSFDFHRGSSAGSKASNEVIRNIVKNK